jgi:hypothetical protein
VNYDHEVVSAVLSTPNTMGFAILDGTMPVSVAQYAFDAVSGGVTTRSVLALNATTVSACTAHLVPSLGVSSSALNISRDRFMELTTLQQQAEVDMWVARLAQIVPYRAAFETPTCWPLSDVLWSGIPLSFSSQSDASCSVASASTSFLYKQFAPTVLSSVLLSSQSSPYFVGLPGEVISTAQFIMEAGVRCDNTHLITTYPTLRTLPSAVAIFLVSLSILGLAWCVFLVFIVIRYRNVAIFKSASVLFLLLFIVGCALAYGTLPTLVVEKPDVLECAAPIWIMAIGYTIVFGTLAFKNYRVYRIFATTKLKLVKINNAELLMYIFGLLVIDIILLGSWNALYPPERVRILSDTQTDFIYECSAGGNFQFFFLPLVIIKVLLLLGGLFLAIKVRNVESLFNESAWLGASSAAGFFTLLVIAPTVAYLSLSSAQRDAYVVMLGLGVWFMATAVSMSIFVPKLYLFFTDNLAANKVIANGSNASSLEEDYAVTAPGSKRTSRISTTGTTPLSSATPGGPARSASGNLKRTDSAKGLPMNAAPASQRLTRGSSFKASSSAPPLETSSQPNSLSASTAPVPAPAPAPSVKSPSVEMAPVTLRAPASSDPLAAAASATLPLPGTNELPGTTFSFPSASSGSSSVSRVLPLSSSASSYMHSSPASTSSHGASVATAGPPSTTRAFL